MPLAYAAEYALIEAAVYLQKEEGMALGVTRVVKVVQQVLQEEKQVLPVVFISRPFRHAAIVAVPIKTKRTGSTNERRGMCK